MSHICHAIKCKKECPPKYLMCKQHWSMVPADLQAAVWGHYRPGQERDKNPSAEYMRASMNAIKSVLRQEYP